MPPEAAGAVLAAWTGLVLVLAVAHRLHEGARRLGGVSEASGPVSAGVPFSNGLSRWERDRRIGATFLLAAASMLSAAGWGAAALRWLAPAALTPLFHLLFALVLGWGIQSHAFLLLGLAGRLRRSWVAAMLAAGVAVGLPAFRAGWERLGTLAAPLPWNLPAAIAALFCLAILVPTAVACFTPPRSFDAHAYHLELPRRYAESGRLTYVPFMAHSPWPQAGQLLFLPSFLFRCAHLPQILSTSMGITLTALAFEAARAGAGLEAAFMAALLLLGVIELPFQMTESTVDVALGLFTMASLCAGVLWIGSGEGSLLILAGVFAGLAASTKITALVLVALMGAAGTAAAVWAGTPLSAPVVFVFVAILVAAPWYVRSAWLTGNPVFHFATRVFPTRNWAPSSEAAHRAVAHAHGWGPVQGARGWARYAVTQVVQNPVGWGAGLVGLAPAVILFPPGRLPLLLGAIALALTLATLALTDQIRLLFGSAAGVSAAVGAAAAGSAIALPEWYRSSVATLFGVLALLGTLHALHHKLRGTATRERRASYLRRFLPYYDDFLWMNANLPPGARILLWTTRGFLLERDYVWLPPWQQGVFDFDRIRDASVFWDELKKNDITHVYHTDLEINRRVFGWLHDLHEEMVRRGLLVEDRVSGGRCTLYKVA